MTSVQQRISDALQRNAEKGRQGKSMTKDGKIKGMSQTKEQRAVSYMKVTSRVVNRPKKADLTGKPRSWKQVCDNARTVNIPQYTRIGTRNGKLAQVTIAAHCRNPRK